MILVLCYEVIRVGGEFGVSWIGYRWLWFGVVVLGVMVCVGFLLFYVVGEGLSFGLSMSGFFDLILLGNDVMSWGELMILMFLLGGVLSLGMGLSMGMDNLSCCESYVNFGCDDDWVVVCVCE